MSLATFLLLANIINVQYSTSYQSIFWNSSCYISRILGWFIFLKVSPTKLFFKPIVLLTDLSNLCKFQQNLTSFNLPPTAIFVWHICGSQKTQFWHFCKFLRPILTSKIVHEMWYLCHLRAKYLKKLSSEENPGYGTALN